MINIFGVAFVRLEYDTIIRYGPSFMVKVNEFGFEIDKGPNFEWLLGKWFHFCYVVEFQANINKTHGEVTQKTYLDGEIKHFATYNGEYYFNWGNGTILVGASPTSFNFDELSPKETFGGRLTEYNFWNRTRKKN